MTMIASVADGLHLVAISDIVLSINEVDSDREIILPLRDEPATYQFQDHAIAGVTQKAVLLSPNTLLLWAGRHIVAQAVVRALRESIAADRSIDLHETVQGLQLTATEYREISLILMTANQDGTTTRQGLHVQHGKIEGAYTVFAGTGWFDFIANTIPVFDVPDPHPALNFLRPWLMRIAHSLAMEDFEGEALSYAYGGWHEVTVVRDCEFAKWPYLVKFWKRSGDEIIEYPLLSSWYSGGRLIIMRMSGNLDGSPRFAFHVISSDRIDIADASPENLLADYQLPEFQLHMIMIEDSTFRIELRPGSWPGYSVLTEAEGIRIEHGEELRAMIFANPTAGTIARPADVEIT